MAGITLQTAQAQLELWIEADQRVSRNQSYSIAGRDYTRADAAAITAKIEFWDRKVRELTATAAGTGAGRVRRGVPLP